MTLSRSKQFVYFIAAEHIQYPPWKLGRLRTHVADLALATAQAEEWIDVADITVAVNRDSFPRLPPSSRGSELN